MWHEMCHVSGYSVLLRCYLQTVSCRVVCFVVHEKRKTEMKHSDLKDPNPKNHLIIIIPDYHLYYCIGRPRYLLVMLSEETLPYIAAISGGAVLLGWWMLRGPPPSPNPFRLDTRCPSI